MKNEKICSFVILSYNQVDFTKNCLDSIRRNTATPYELIIVDNHSNDETLQYLRQQKDIILIENQENKGFAGGCNQGMKVAKGDYILLLNNDTIVTKGYLENMLQLLESDKDIGIVGPVTNNTIGNQKIKVDIPYENITEIEAFGEKISSSNKEACRASRLIGFCMLFRKEFMNEVGIFDENFRIGNYEDDDLCIRALLAKKKLYICNKSFVYHYKRASFDKNNLPFEEISLKNKLYLEEKWDVINWNHHSETNKRIVENLVDKKVKSVLHLGCGVGSLGLEVKNEISDCYFIGTDNHETRMKIVKQVYDEVYQWDDELTFLNDISIDKFDAIVIECTIELSGVKILDKLLKYANKDTIIIVRVFNKNHVSSIEKIVSGEVWGKTISASLDEFKYKYGMEILDDFNHYGLKVLECIEVKKELKYFQNELYNKLKDYGTFEREGLVYNRVFFMGLE